jgi:hypothetical protein
MVVPAMAFVVLLCGVAVVLIHAAGRSRARALAEDVRAKVEPYLRRKAAEAGLPAAAPIWTARSAPEEIVGYAARLAGRLLDAERDGRPAASSLEYARTQPQPGPEKE